MQVKKTLRPSLLCKRSQRSQVQYLKTARRDNIASSVRIATTKLLTAIMHVTEQTHNYIQILSSHLACPSLHVARVNNASQRGDNMSLASVLLDGTIRLCETTYNIYTSQVYYSIQCCLSKQTYQSCSLNTYPYLVGPGRSMVAGAI